MPSKNHTVSSVQPKQPVEELDRRENERSLLWRGPNLEMSETVAIGHVEVIER